jgi:hypothetical protein
MNQPRRATPAPVEPSLSGPTQRELRQIPAAHIPIEELAERYQAGATLDEMAALYRSLQYRVDPDKIRRRLVAVGIQIRSADRSTDPTRPGLGRRGAANFPLSTEELAERYRAGASLVDLAILCGCSSGKIHRILFEAGVEIRLIRKLDDAVIRQPSL